ANSTSTQPSSRTSIHVTAIDSIVNVNSLFTIAIFIGFSFTVPKAHIVGNTQSCHVGIETVRRLIVSEIVSFSSFLFSSLIAQSLKLTINSLNSLDPIEHLKADINSSALKFGLLGSAVGSVVGCLSLIVSISYAIQVKLGVISCGGESVFAVAVLAVLVGIYIMATILHLFHCFIPQIMADK
ncbi:uncharacterized protein LOC111371195, partial [Olea europaea subsp. europaea]